MTPVACACGRRTLGRNEGATLPRAASCPRPRTDLEWIARRMRLCAGASHHLFARCHGHSHRNCMPARGRMRTVLRAPCAPVCSLCCSSPRGPCARWCCSSGAIATFPATLCPLLRPPPLAIHSFPLPLLGALCTRSRTGVRQHVCLPFWLSCTRDRSASLAISVRTSYAHKPEAKPKPDTAPGPLRSYTYIHTSAHLPHLCARAWPCQGTRQRHARA